jgi:hypothetical protein
MWKWLRQQSKRLLCCGFWRTGNAIRQVYQCSWRICRKINIFFQVQISRFTFYIHLSPSYWLSIVVLVSASTGCLDIQDLSTTPLPQVLRVYCAASLSLIRRCHP